MTKRVLEPADALYDNCECCGLKVFARFVDAKTFLPAGNTAKPKVCSDCREGLAAFDFDSGLLSRAAEFMAKYE